jgi:hypothetical protein
LLLTSVFSDLYVRSPRKSTGDARSDPPRRLEPCQIPLINQTAAAPAIQTETTNQYQHLESKSPSRSKTEMVSILVPLLGLALVAAWFMRQKSSTKGRQPPGPPGLFPLAL